MLAGHTGAALGFPFPRRLLGRRFTPRSVFMEVGAADCELALQAASYVERVYAIDVSGQFLRGAPVPCNLRLVLGDGVRVPPLETAVDLAFSDGFVDRLPAGEALEHLRSVRRSLASAGQYVCVSSSPGRLRRDMLAAGFSSVRCYAGALRLPWACLPLVSKPLYVAGCR